MAELKRKDDELTTADLAGRGDALRDSEKDAKVLTTVKHFPGHGDTATDSHMNLVTITADRARMDSM